MTDYNIKGWVDPKFSKVEEVFRKNFEEGWEFEGAAFAVYHKGKLVADLYGGYSDASADALWNDKTKTVVFSVTKSIGALCVAMLVDRGWVAYEDKVTTFWPEFGQNGKEDITVEHIVNHQAGLPMFVEDISLEVAKNDHERIAKIIEKSPPLWKPGTKSGYHAVTYGWLVDQIVRKVDPKKRSIGTFFREEVAQKHSIDLHIGLPPEEEYTVARLRPTPFKYFLRELWNSPTLATIFFAMIWVRISNFGFPEVFKYPGFMKLQGGKLTINNPELHFIEQAGALGITRAKDLAKLFSLVLKGEIISKKTSERFYNPIIFGQDAVIPMKTIKGHGFFYEPHPKKPGKYIFGHPGYGGNNVMVDPEEELVVAYVTNGLKSGMGDLTYTYRTLRNAAFDSLDKFPKENVANATGKDAVDETLLS